MKNTNAFAVAGAMVTAGLAISLGAAFSSCSSENYSLGMSRRRAQTEVKENYSRYVVPKKNNVLYVTVPGLTDQPMTRADGEEMTTLESLLDRGQTKSESFYQYDITEIPLKPDEGEMGVNLTKAGKGGTPGTTVSHVFRSLVTTKNNMSGKNDEFIMTLIPTDENYEEYKDRGFAYLNNDDFHGIAIYGNLDGSFRHILNYGDGPIVEMDSVAITEADSTAYILSIGRIRTGETRAVSDSQELDPAYCIAYARHDNTDWSAILSAIREQEERDLWEQQRERGHSGGGGGGGSNSSNNNQDKNEELIDSIETVIIEDVRVFTVTVTNNIPELQQTTNEGYFVDIIGPLLNSHNLTRGSGKYKKEQLVSIETEPYVQDRPPMPYKPVEYRFSYWSGNIPRPGATEMSFKIAGDIRGTAYYFASGSGDIIKAEGRPCYNGEDGFVNPFPSDKMVFQPSGSKDKNGKTTYVNQLGGTYGPVRTRKDGSIKWHRGWDIAAAVGTPIFAACDGIIAGGRRYCVEQPDRIKLDNDNYGYPDRYSGDKDSYGNRISIISSNDPIIMIGYNHLLAGNPIAKNPRTGEPYKPGDSIMKGDIIGYVGQTGNAVEAIGTHLHLEIRVKGRFADPANYVNGAINWKDKSKKDKLIDYKIIDISCEEYINNND